MIDLISLAVTGTLMAPVSISSDPARIDNSKESVVYYRVAQAGGAGGGGTGGQKPASKEQKPTDSGSGKK